MAEELLGKSRWGGAKSDYFRSRFSAKVGSRNSWTPLERCVLKTTRSIKLVHFPDPVEFQDKYTSQVNKREKTRRQTKSHIDPNVSPQKINPIFKILCLRSPSHFTHRARQEFTTFNYDQYTPPPPWVWAVAFSHGLGAWPKDMAEDHSLGPMAFGPRPWAMDCSHGLGQWPRAMAVCHGF